VILVRRLCNVRARVCWKMSELLEEADQHVASVSSLESAAYFDLLVAISTSGTPHLLLRLVLLLLNKRLVSR
jgi:hypothetical protein